MNFELSPRSLDSNLVHEFFWKFSVFECALKSTGFVSPKREDAQADWDRFGKEIANDFPTCQVAGFADAIATLNAMSLQKQVQHKGKLSWRPVRRNPLHSEGEHTLYLLKTVRNNLFHGGNYPEGKSVNQVDRDTDILRLALIILYGCYDLHPGIKHSIHMMAA